MNLARRADILRKPWLKTAPSRPPRTPITSPAATSVRVKPVMGSCTPGQGQRGRQPWHTIHQAGPSDWSRMRKSTLRWGHPLNGAAHVVTLSAVRESATHCCTEEDVTSTTVVSAQRVPSTLPLASVPSAEVHEAMQHNGPQSVCEEGLPQHYLLPPAPQQNGKHIAASDTSPQLLMRAASSTNRASAGKPVERMPGRAGSPRGLHSKGTASVGLTRSRAPQLRRGHLLWGSQKLLPRRLLPPLSQSHVEPCRYPSM